MFNMGFTEIIVLGAIALLVIGPKQLPEVARVIASLFNEFKRATSEITESFTEVKRDMNKTMNDVQHEITDTETWIKEQAKKVLEEREKKGIVVEDKSASTEITAEDPEEEGEGSSS